MGSIFLFSRIFQKKHLFPRKTALHSLIFETLRGAPNVAVVLGQITDKLVLDKKYIN